MNQTVISVSDLVKTYQVTKKRPGLRGSLAGLFHRERETFTLSLIHSWVNLRDIHSPDGDSPPIRIPEARRKT